MAAVSDEMRRRVGRALDAGERPTLRGNNLRLGTVVLQRADGRDTPALAVTEETMRQRGIDTTGAFDSFATAAPVRRGRSTYATDTLGREHRLTRPVNGENRATRAGRRFYSAQSYTRWLVHVPTYMYRRSTGQRFREGRHDLNSEDPKGTKICRYRSGVTFRSGWSLCWPRAFSRPCPGPLPPSAA